MNKIFNSVLLNGISPEFSEDLKKNIRITNILNAIFIILVIPFLFIFNKSFYAVIITTIPIFLHLLSLFLIKFKLHKIGRFIFSITTSTSVYIVAAFIYLDNGTNGFAAKFLILGTIILPFIIFPFQDKRYILPAIVLNIFYLSTFDHTNSIFNLPGLEINFDTPASRIFSVFTTFFMFIISFALFKYNLAKRTNELLKANLKYKEINEELQSTEEELRQNNEELLTLKEEIQNQLEHISNKERLLNTMTNAISDAVILINNEENIEFWNKGAEKIFGYTKNEVLYKNLHNIITPHKYREQAFKNFAMFQNTGKGNALNKRIELESLKKDGSNFPIELFITPIKIDEKWHAVGVVRDITERKQKENALKKSENKFKSIFNSSYAGITILNNEGVHIDTNPNCENIHGYTRDELIGKPFRDFAHPDDIIYARNAIGLLLTGKKDKVEIEVRLFHKHTNNTIWIHTVLTKYIDVLENQNNNILVVFQDITHQKETEKQLKQKNKTIAEAHKDITDSINYAKTIQQSLMPSKKIIDSYLHKQEHFIFFKPKEVVSGDFYYFNKFEDSLVFTVADCTGHGVPGGFMTVLAITYLDDILKRETGNPAYVLEELRKKIKRIFKISGNKNHNGLDIALCFLNTKTGELKYAGAYNPLYIIRNKELIEYKATRNPIGYYPFEQTFKNNKIQLNNGDRIYICSDGFQDQIGKNGKKKFFVKNLRQLLIDIHQESLTEQKIIMESVFNKWKETTDQTDDVLVFGMKFKNNNKIYSRSSQRNKKNKKSF